MTKTNRPHKLYLRVSTDELALLEEMARAKGLPVSTFVRSIAIQHCWVTMLFRDNDPVDAPETPDTAPDMVQCNK